MRRNENTFERVYRRLYHTVFCFALSRGASRADAEEISAEAFVRLWRCWDTLEARDETEIKKWMYVTAGNIVREYRRNSVADVPLEEVESVLFDGEHTQIAEEAQFRHYLKQIERALGEREWKLFRLAFLEQLPYEQLAEQLHCSSTALRVRIHRLRGKLRPLLPQLFGEHDQKGDSAHEIQS